VIGSKQFDALFSSELGTDATADVFFKASGGLYTISFPFRQADDETGATGWNVIRILG
jgi:hypothetical protein